MRTPISAYVIVFFAATVIAGFLLGFISLPSDGEEEFTYTSEKEIDWDKDLLPKIKTGDWVSFHWNQVVEVLKDEDRRNLEKYTKKATNYK